MKKTMTKKSEPLPKEDFSGGSENDRPLHERIAERAYALFQQRGQRHGRDLEDWLEAERMILSERGAADPSKPPLSTAVRLKGEGKLFGARKAS